MRPNGVPLISEFRKSDHTHRKAIDASGDYKICFDNSASHFHSKIVYFEVVVESDGDDDADYFGSIEGIERGDAAAGDYGADVKDIEEAMKGIRERMQRSRHFQDQIRNFEFRDRSIAEHNYERVNFWSTVQVLSMMIGKSGKTSAFSASDGYYFPYQILLQPASYRLCSSAAFSTKNRRYTDSGRDCVDSSIMENTWPEVIN